MGHLCGYDCTVLTRSLCKVIACIRWQNGFEQPHLPGWTVWNPWLGLVVCCATGPRETISTIPIATGWSLPFLCWAHSPCWEEGTGVGSSQQTQTNSEETLKDNQLFIGSSYLTINNGKKLLWLNKPDAAVQSYSFLQLSTLAGTSLWFFCSRQSHTVALPLYSLCLSLFLLLIH